jgi:drug/metabolite transporter (DMT)-like permease
VTDKSVEDAGPRSTAILAMAGFIAVAVAQVTNMILARANAGEIPPFSLAFARWTIVAAGLAPFAFNELKSQWSQIWLQRWQVLAAGFLGMFLCGGPVYIAGVTTTAINIALIMSLSPVVVLAVSWLMGLESIGITRLLGVVLALAGALLIILRGDATALHSPAFVIGDLLVVGAMLAWSGYTLLQSRAAPGVPFIGRICLFAAAGALFSLPFAIAEAISEPHRVASWHALGVYLFAGIVPGILAYGGFAWLDVRFGSVRTSLVLYVGPVASAVLSFLMLGEPPHAIQLLGGALILGGVWASLRK